MKKLLIFIIIIVLCPFGVSVIYGSLNDNANSTTLLEPSGVIAYSIAQCSHLLTFSDIAFYSEVIPQKINLFQEEYVQIGVLGLTQGIPIPNVGDTSDPMEILRLALHYDSLINADPNSAIGRYSLVNPNNPELMPCVTAVARRVMDANGDPRTDVDFNNSIFGQYLASAETLDGYINTAITEASGFLQSHDVIEDGFSLDVFQNVEPVTSE